MIDYDDDVVGCHLPYRSWGSRRSLPRFKNFPLESQNVWMRSDATPTPVTSEVALYLSNALNVTLLSL